MLLDGNGVLFKEKSPRDEEKGSAEAARPKVYEEIYKIHLETTGTVVRVFVDLDRLSQKHRDTGILF